MYVIHVICYMLCVYIYIYMYTYIYIYDYIKTSKGINKEWKEDTANKKMRRPYRNNR